MSFVGIFPASWSAAPLSGMGFFWGTDTSVFILYYFTLHSLPSGDVFVWHLHVWGGSLHIWQPMLLRWRFWMMQIQFLVTGLIWHILYTCPWPSVFPLPIIWRRHLSVHLLLTSDGIVYMTICGLGFVCRCLSRQTEEGRIIWWCLLAPISLTCQPIFKWLSDLGSA